MRKNPPLGIPWLVWVAGGAFLYYQWRKAGKPSAKDLISRRDMSDPKQRYVFSSEPGVPKTCYDMHTKKYVGMNVCEAIHELR